jgi:hypothetical protein
MSLNEFMGQCDFKTFAGNHCPSSAHEKLEFMAGDKLKKKFFCYHHLRVIKAIMTGLKGVSNNEESRNPQP